MAIRQKITSIVNDTEKLKFSHIAYKGVKQKSIALKKINCILYTGSK